MGLSQHYRGNKLGEVLSFYTDKDAFFNNIFKKQKAGHYI